jgi:hypothetical protein
MTLRGPDTDPGNDPVSGYESEPVPEVAAEPRKWFDTVPGPYLE